MITIQATRDELPILKRLLYGARFEYKVVVVDEGDELVLNEDQRWKIWRECQKESEMQDIKDRVFICADLGGNELQGVPPERVVSDEKLMAHIYGIFEKRNNTDESYWFMIDGCIRDGIADRKEDGNGKDNS